MTEMKNVVWDELNNRLDIAKMGLVNLNTVILISNINEFINELWENFKQTDTAHINSMEMGTT